MRHILLVAFILLCALSGIIAGTRVGGHYVEYPFRFSQRRPLPDDPPFDQLFPPRLGEFERMAVLQPIHTVTQNRLQAWGAATYTRPGDPRYIYIELKLYSDEQIAGLLINPSDWRLHSHYANKYFVEGIRTPYVFTMTSSSYDTYSLEYVNGRWNVSMHAVNDLDALETFADLYPY